MTYYRLALRDRQTARWIWKTTAVTSLQAVFQLLRIYSAHPRGDTRVFTASSKEDLSEMLSRENNGLVSGSVIATQFLQERNLAVRERAQSASEQSGSAQAAQPAAAGTTTATGVPSNLGMSVPEKKRLEIELGPGGDHDTPYLFTLPFSLKERLAWIRLQTRVQAGELPS